MGSLYCLNVGFRDATIIISDYDNFLVDCHNIDNFSNLLPKSEHLQGVFITHQHRDHLEFIRNSNAKYTLISTRSGVHNNIPHPTALCRYRDHTRRDVRRTDVDGSWRWSF